MYTSLDQFLIKKYVTGLQASWWLQHVLSTFMEPFLYLALRAKYIAMVDIV